MKTLITPSLTSSLIGKFSHAKQRLVAVAIGEALIILLLLLFIGAPAIYSGRVYYIDPVSGLDTNNGRSTSAPLKSVGNFYNNAAAYPVSAGDSILFKRGTIARIPTDPLGGNAYGGIPVLWSTVLIGAYGTGDKPILSGAKVLSGWVSLGSNKYSVANILTLPEIVVINGVNGQRKYTNSLTAQGDWYWGSNTLYFYSSQAVSTLEVSSLKWLILLNNVNDVTVRDLTLQHASDPIVIGNGSGHLIDTVSIRNVEGHGAIYGLSYDYTDSQGKNIVGTLTNTVVRNCDIQNVKGSEESIVDNDGNGVPDNHGNGIFFYGTNCKGNNINGNNVSYLGQEGIVFYGGSDNLISGNTVHHSGQSGIRIYAETSSGNIIEHNISYENAQSSDDRYGIDLLRVGNNNIIRYNTVYGQHDALWDNAISNDPSNEPGMKYGSGGIRFDGGNWVGHDYMDSVGNAIYYNVVYDEFTGIDVFNFPNVLVANNVVYNSAAIRNYAPKTLTVNGQSITVTSIGIALTGHDFDNCGRLPKNIKVQNNIVVHKEPTALMLAQLDTSNNQVNYNLYYSANSAPFNVQWVPYNFVQWRSQTGFDLNSPQPADPRFKDVIANDLNHRDFRLLAGSPAIAAGLAISGLTVDIDGATLTSGAAPDLGAYKYQQPVVVAPTAPSGLTATAASATQVNLAWVDNSNNESGFKLERKVSGGTYQEIASFSQNLTSYSDLGVSAGTSYVYRIKAYNSGGDSSYSAEVSVTSQYTLAVTAGTGGTVTKSSNKTSYAVNEQVTITATPNSGYAFSGWSGGVTGTTNPLVLTMNSNKSITANFAVSNVAPVAKNVSASVKKGSSVTITLLATDANGDKLTYRRTSSPSKGTATIVGTGPSVTYKAPSTVSIFGAKYTFKYRANDGKADSNEATVTVSVKY